MVETITVENPKVNIDLKEQWREFIANPLKVLEEKKIWPGNKMPDVFKKIMTDMDLPAAKISQFESGKVLQGMVRFNPLFYIKGLKSGDDGSFAQLLTVVDQELKGELTETAKKMGVDVNTNTNDREQKNVRSCFGVYVAGLIGSFRDDNDFSSGDYIDSWNKEIVPLFPQVNQEKVKLSNQKVGDIRNILIRLQGQPSPLVGISTDGMWTELAKAKPEKDLLETAEIELSDDELVDAYVGYFQSWISMIRYKALKKPETQAYLNKWSEDTKTKSDDPNRQETLSRIKKIIGVMDQDFFLRVVAKGNYLATDDRIGGSALFEEFDREIDQVMTEDEPELLAEMV
jgi:hypothetical protein